MKIFSERLKFERKSMGYSQRQIAEMLHISQGTYANYEHIGTKNGREPSIEMIVQIAKILDVTTDYLFGMEDLK